MRQKRDAAMRSLWLMLIASVVLPLLLFIFAAWENYRQTIELADERIDQALALSAEQALRVFQSINVTFDSVEQITRGRDDGSLRSSEAELHERLTQLDAAVPDIASIWVLDSQADAIASSLLYPVPPAWNSPERAYLKAQLATETGPHVGELLRIKLTDRLIFPVSRRRFDSSGTMTGVTVISVSPHAFEKFYEPLAAKTSGSFALIREDGALLARYPLPSVTGIVLGPTTGFGQLIARSPAGGRYTTISDVDHLERRFAVRKLNGFPLYVSSSLETKDITRTWLRYMAGHLVFGLPALALVVILIVLAMRRTSALYAESERRERLEGELRQSQKMEAIGQLTGGIAHDFNNLLMIIGGSLETLARRVTLDERTQRLVDTARMAVTRGAKLNQQLLAFARRQDLKVEPICVSDLLPEFETLLDRALGESVKLHVVTEPSLWFCSTDRNQLETAILNLAINSRDAMPAGGTVRLLLSNQTVGLDLAKRWEGRPGDYVVTRVEDTGTGMTPEQLSHAFEPFFTTKGVGQGTGLGLSQVYGFARQSGGFVSIESAPGRGTSVSIYLPRVEPPARSETPATSDSGVTPASGSVLVVEDDPEVLHAARNMVEELGYTVATATSASEALALLRRERFDLVFSDVIMANGATGIELAQDIQQRYPDLPVLLTSGYTAQHISRLETGEMRPLLYKPYALSDLATAFQQARDDWTARRSSAVSG